MCLVTVRVWSWVMPFWAAQGAVQQWLFDELPLVMNVGTQAVIGCKTCFHQQFHFVVRVLMLVKMKSRCLDPAYY